MENEMSREREKRHVKMETYDMSSLEGKEMRKEKGSKGMRGQVALCNLSGLC